MLERFGVPGIHDEAPYGTCLKKISSLSEEYELFVQAAPDSELPKWVSVGIYTNDTPISVIEKDIQSIIKR